MLNLVAVPGKPDQCHPHLFLSGANIRQGVHGTESLIDTGDELAQFIGKTCSFDEDTPVATDEGAIPISEIDIGDQVLAWDEVTDATGYYIVTATTAHWDPVIVHLTIDGETIDTTPEHPFYVVEVAPWLSVGETEGRWVPAGELQVGDAIQQADGTTGIVAAVEFEVTEQLMYNLTVADAHTFFVGDGEWLVHNAKCYRVEGTPNLRFNVDSSGNVILLPGKKGMLHLSFGGPGHAEHFLNLKINGSLPGVHVKEFEVSDDFLDLIRKDAVPQDKPLPGRPQIDDPHIANPLGSEAYGIPATYFEFLIDAILPGSGSIWK